MLPPETGKDHLVQLLVAIFFMIWPVLAYVLFGFTFTQMAGGWMAIYFGYMSFVTREDQNWLTYVFIAITLVGIGMVLFGAKAP